MADGARKLAAYQDVVTAPEHWLAELIDGDLYMQPRPSIAHQVVSTVLGAELDSPFRRGRGGPGGWIFADQPELHLAKNVLAPDLAGWRRERMPVVEHAACVTLPPDWVCEVLSPSTARTDRVTKLPIYAHHHGVRHIWIIDPLARTLEVFRLEGERLFLHTTHAEDERIRAEPFDAVELELGMLWADLAPSPPTL